MTAASPDMSVDYKSTEIGVIPSDWTLIPLGRLVTSVEYGTSAKSNPKGHTPVLRMGNLQGGMIDWKDLVYTDDDSEIRKYKLHQGDVLFNRTNTIDLVGKCAIYNGERPAIFAGYLIRINADNSVLDSRYLNYILNTEFSKRHSAKVLSLAVGQANINGQKVRAYPIPLPPTLAEQEAIAGALGDADAWIESLEQLLAKKRHLKQAAMQQLLTGETRLPRFEEKWEKKRLGDIGSFLKGRGVHKDDARSGSLPCVRYGELYTRHSNYVRNFFSWISREVAMTATLLKRGDLLFAGSGETRDEIGKCIAFVHDCEAYAGGDIVVLRPRSASALFLGYYLNTASINAQKASKGQGDAIVHIGAQALGSLECTLPPYPEQVAIAEVLSDMDTEITALQTKLTKARAIKQGMMQQLLTGRIRLV